MPNSEPQSRGQDGQLAFAQTKDRIWQQLKGQQQ
jgi:hypothetical protein